MRSLVLTLCTFFFIQTASASIQCRRFLDLTSKPNSSGEPQVDASLRILNVLLDEGFIKPKQFKHAKEDLEAGREQIRSKRDQASFKEILNEWTIYLETMELQIKNYKKMNEKDQKAWAEKLHLAAFFGVGHFVTFLESSNTNVYSKINHILKHMNALPKDIDVKVFLFELEKQVMRYFSVKEFKKCKF